MPHDHALEVQCARSSQLSMPVQSSGTPHARQKILTDEHPRRAGARVSDEVVLFPLRVEPFVFRTLKEGGTVSGVTGAEWEEYRKKVVIDAEKAFVHLLDPEYNVQKFATYPRSLDGL